MTATVDEQNCLRCGICTQVCFGVPSSSANVGELPVLAGEDTCIECGHCAAVCPVEAVQLEDYSTEPVKTERMPAPDQVMELVRSRRSIRCFLERPVERDLLLELIEAARFAPSATNIQSTEYIVVTDPEIIAEVSRLTTEFLDKTVHQIRNPLLRPVLHLVAPNELAAIMPYLDIVATFSDRLRGGEDPILYGAPALIVFHSRPDVNSPQSMRASRPTTRHSMPRAGAWVPCSPGSSWAPADASHVYSACWMSLPATASMPPSRLAIPGFSTSVG